MTSAIRLIVFDLGNVMIRLAGGWEGACACAGIAYRPFTLTAEERARFLKLEVLFETNALTAAAHRAALCELLQQRYTCAEIAAIYQAIIREELPGVHDIVLALRQGGYRTACLSNTCAPHWVELTNPARYPGIGALDHHHASHLFGVAKPDARIYRRFEEATGCSAGEILFFDDKADNVAGAQACGWHAEQITPAQPSAAQIHAACGRYGIALDLPISRG